MGKSSGSAEQERTKTAQSRRWCFTINNYSDGEQTAWREGRVAVQDARYSVWGIVGFETAPTTGTKHIQGYVFLTTKRRLLGVKQLLNNNGAHVTVALGTHEQNRIYCRKENDWIEWGTYPTEPEDQGHHGERGGQAEVDRWKRIRAAAERGDWENVPDRIYLTHYRNLKAIADDARPKPNNLDEPCGLWLFGRSGVGKSTRAREAASERVGNVGNGLAPTICYFDKDAATKWWDGYAGEDVCIIDDVEPSHKHLGYYLKIWADKWAFKAELKGGSRFIRPKLVIVTSQYRISECFGDPSTANALARRFRQEEVIHWRERGNGAGLGGGRDHGGSGRGRRELGDGRGPGRHHGGDVGGSNGWLSEEESDPNFQIVPLSPGIDLENFEGYWD